MNYNIKFVTFFLFCFSMNEVKLHECPIETKLNSTTEKNFDLDNYVLNTTGDVDIVNKCKEKAKYFALSESLQNFLEHVAVLEKYYSDKFSYPTNQTLMLLILGDSPIQDLIELRDFWLRKLKKDHIIRSQDHLANHILVKYQEVIKFIDEKFEICKEIITKITDKEAYNNMVTFYGKNDYPALTSLCIFCFDAMRFKKGKLNVPIFSAVLYERLKKEAPYFGLEPRDESAVQKDE